jgi:polysaccharide deacetylase family protein (PEP-CTERM system associated)
MHLKNFFTVDVEDYFQVHLFRHAVRVGEWGRFDARVGDNTRKILDLLAERGTRATFFVLGWIAERKPGLVKAIHRMGHEVASHGYWHRVIHSQTPAQFREDIKSSKGLLEDLTGEAVLGYRAPTYSITRETLWALPIIREEGYRYDSSVFPIHHDHYGIPDAPRFPFRWNLRSEAPKPDSGAPGSADDPADLPEYPISTVAFCGVNLPIGGGGYFRLVPYRATRMGLERINGKERMPFMFYLHPWEIDPAQPVVRNIPPMARFRHYVNLRACLGKLERLLADFSFGSIGESRDA